MRAIRLELVRGRIRIYLYEYDGFVSIIRVSERIERIRVHND